jgi:type III pantothenate kinase
MNLVVDIGNSRIKYAFFEDGIIQSQNSVEPSASETIFHDVWMNKGTRAILSASGKLDDSFLQKLKNEMEVIVFDHNTKLPVTIAYETPETLGKDRIAGAVAAWKMFPGESSLIIDMGTCITTNIINTKGEYLGGTISPGVQMRTKAMAAFTENLPLVDLELPKELIGRNTITALQNGVIRGTYYEIQTFIDNVKPIFGINNVILTGGDAKIFGNLLNFEIFALPNLVLSGLHEILQYNA